MSDDDYSNHPPSVTELRSDRSGLAHDWTARDVLISLLRRIDAGELRVKDLAVVAALEAEADEDEEILVTNNVRDTTRLVGLLSRSVVITASNDD